MESKYKVLFLLSAIALISKEALAAQHVVGGSQGWDESTDFSAWASGQKFKLGDQLVFKYTSGLHSLVELGSETAYKNCDIGTALDSKNSGTDVMKMDIVGTRYFACGTMGHCDGGMKLKITTVAAAGEDATPSSSDSTPSSSDSTPPSSGSTPSSSSSPYSISKCSNGFAVVTVVAVLLAIFVI